MNEACIMKLGRNLQAESNDFWCQVVWGKYKREYDTNNGVMSKGVDSHLW